MLAWVIAASSSAAASQSSDTEVHRTETALELEAADEVERFPQLAGDIVVRLGGNNVYSAEEPRLTTIDEFVQVIASPELRLMEGLSVFAEVRLETTAPPEEDRRFQDEGLFVRSLYGRLAPSERVAVHAGKFTPSFALASLVTPGMYGNNYNKEIELIERVGFGAEYTLGSRDVGLHKLSASTFFEDTSFLSESLGSNRGTTTLDDGGASNTESFESFTLSLEGSDFAELSGLRYKLGFVHEAAGRGDDGDETGLAFAAMHSWKLGDRCSLVAIGEIAPLWNFQGTADNIVYSSAGLVVQVDRWTAIVSGTYRRRDLSSGGTWDDYQVQTSLEYAIGNGFSVALAHEFNRSEDLDSRQIGIRISYQYEF
ncbi:MAG: hypothetical protein ACFCBV_06580 [Phycisphaerales bacterium]